MAKIRQSHPGFFKVILAYFLFHTYNGIVFLFNYPSEPTAHIYELAFSVLPQTAWGVIFLTLGLALLVSVHKLPFLITRHLLRIGLLLDVFWLVSFLLTMFSSDLDAPTAVSAWLLAVIIEYAGTQEVPINPAMEKHES